MTNCLINALSELAKIYAIMGQEYKSRAYHKAILELKNARMDSISPAIRDKISEYNNSGRIAELEKLKKDTKIRAYMELSRILGVGPATIEKWWDLKIRSIANLRAAVAKKKVALNKMQKYGLRYYDDLNTRIPRAEVASLGGYIKQTLIQINPNIIFEIAGSYRRGAESSGDIDIIVSDRGHFVQDLLESLVTELSHDPRYIDTLSKGLERVTFLYKYADRVRQVDILNIPYPSYYAALVYFTGSYEFNTVMRGFAKTHGFRLNQNGLFKISAKGMTHVPIQSEQELFQLLGLEYVSPSARDNPTVKPLKK